MTTPSRTVIFRKLLLLFRSRIPLVQNGFQILVPPLTLPILLITSNSHNLMWDPTV
ncbi:unnamed protein product [Arabidopsis halleri]